MRVVRIKALRVPGNIPSGRTVAKRVIKAGARGGQPCCPPRSRASRSRPEPIIIPAIGRTYRSEAATAKVLGLSQDDAGRVSVWTELAERQADGSVRVRRTNLALATFTRRYH